MSRITVCPYKYKYDLVKWAANKFRISEYKANSYSKSQLYAMYYNSSMSDFQRSYLNAIKHRCDDEIEQHPTDPDDGSWIGR